jgi:hypothetical protein
MIPIAKNLQEALNHFEDNNSPIFCQQGKKASKTCNSLDEAKLFYAKNAKKIRYRVTPIKTK